MSPSPLRAKDLFLAALERPAAERAAFLAESYGGDSELRQEVESLLAFHDDQTSDDDDITPVEPTFAPGELFAGRYRMINRVGRGGIGDVWRADDLVIGTAVALKLIPATAPAARERFLNEVRLARQITHPNICRVFDVGESGGWVFYSMELVRGEDLAALLRRVGRLPSEKVVDIARQLCAGLSAAHARGVLHRDLKPANVMIDDEGVVRLSDFGIAIPRSDASLHLHTGTPGYMAPEQRAPGELLSERTDLYSLGLVLYELLVGHHALKDRNRNTLPPSPSTLVPNIDVRLEQVVMQMLAADPADRPASAEDVTAALPLQVKRGTGPVAPAVHHDTRATWWLAGTALVVIVVVAAVASSFFV
jgi:serine/threonine protein kinase